MIRYEDFVSKKLNRFLVTFALTLLILGILSVLIFTPSEMFSAFIEEGTSEELFFKEMKILAIESLAGILSSLFFFVALDLLRGSHGFLKALKIACIILASLLFILSSFYLLFARDRLYSASGIAGLLIAAYETMATCAPLAVILSVLDYLFMEKNELLKKISPFASAIAYVSSFLLNFLPCFAQVRGVSFFNL